MKIVKIPTGDELHFSNGMSDAAIDAAVREHMKDHIAKKTGEKKEAEDKKNTEAARVAQLFEALDHVAGQNDQIIGALEKIHNAILGLVTVGQKTHKQLDGVLDSHDAAAAQRDKHHAATLKVMKAGRKTKALRDPKSNVIVGSETEEM